MELEIRVCKPEEAKVYSMTFQPELLEKIKKCQEDVMDQDINRLVGEELCSQKDDQGILRFSSRIWLPPVMELKNEILQEAHNLRYSIREYQNVQRFKEELLVARHEEGNCGMD